MVALVLSWGGAARAQTVGILLSDHGGHYSEYLETLSRSLGEQSSRFRLVTLPPGREKPDEATLAKLHLIVAVGVQAMRTAAEWGNAPPVLNVLVPRASHDKLLFESIPLRRRAQFSAIYLDQPLVRQLNLVRQILPGKRRVAVLLGPDSSQLLPRLKSAISRAGLELLSEEVAAEPEIIPAVSRLLTGSDLLLALPDPVVFTRDTARSLLLTTYRHQKPLVGFSQAYVGAGALAAVYSSPAQIARQTADWLRNYFPTRGALPPPAYPAYFSVAVNRSVSRAMGLNLPDEASLQANVDAMSESE